MTTNIQHANINDFIDGSDDNSLDLVITSGPKFTLEELTQKDTLDYYIWQTLVNPITNFYPKVKQSGAVYIILDSYRNSKGCLLSIEPWIEIGIQRTSGWLLHSRIIWNHMDALSNNKKGYVNFYSTILMFIKDVDKLYTNWDYVGGLYRTTQDKLESLFKNNRILTLCSEGRIAINKSDILKSVGNENIILDNGELCEVTTQDGSKVIENLITISCPEGGDVCDPYVRDERVIEITQKLNRVFIGCATSHEVFDYLQRKNI